MRKRDDNDDRRKAEEILKDGLDYAKGGGDPYFRSYSMALKRADEAEKLGRKKEAQFLRDVVQKYVDEEKEDIKNIKPLFECRICEMNNSQVKLFLCGRCKKVRYCSQKCQKIDWKDHKRYCGKLKSMEIEQIRYIFQLAPTRKSIIDEKRLVAPFYFTFDIKKELGDDQVPTPENSESVLYYVITGVKIKKLNRNDMKYLKRTFEISWDKVEYHHFSKAFECPLCEEVCKEGIVLVENMQRLRYEDEPDERLEIRTREFPRITHQTCLQNCALYNCWGDPEFMEMKGMCHVWDLILPDCKVIRKECFSDTEIPLEISPEIKEKCPNLRDFK